MSAAIIVTDKDNYALALDSTLRKSSDGPYATERVHLLSEALMRLERGGIDIVLLDFFLPDSQGLQTFQTIYSQFPSVAIMSLCDTENDALAINAVEHGAQGFLAKSFFNNPLVPQVLRTIIQRKRVEEDLYVEKERTRVTLESIGDGVLSTDVNSNITYLNPEAERLTGWQRDEAYGRNIGEVFHLIEGATRELARNPVELVILYKKHMALHAHPVLIRKDGHEFPVEDSTAPILDKYGHVTGAVITFRDVSEAHAMTRKMAYMAEHDYLTGLPNRMLFGDRLSQAIAYARRHHTQLAVLFLDLDNFKHINDSLGHTIGDKLLESVGKRLSAQIRKSDTVSRHGGDEFLILILEDQQAEYATITAEKILQSFTRPHQIEGHELHITTSIGISVFPDDGDNGETLIKNADNAMYRAKKNGRNNYQFFNVQMNAQSIQRQSVESELRQAIAQKQFVLHYQPKIDLVSGNITGVEALIRWRHPSKGLLYPDSFITVAEESGLILSIGQFVMRQACTDAKQWLEQGRPEISVAVNVSAAEFRDKDFVSNCQRILKETGLDGRYLQIELTESLLMRNVDSSGAILRGLKKLGIQLAIDDFGTGYSSLSYLSRFPIDVLKIDQSFVHDIVANTDNGIIVSAVISMGNSLRHKVVAEGIESSEQLDFLNQQRCEEGQGNFFSLPLPYEELINFFHNAPKPSQMLLQPIA